MKKIISFLIPPLCCFLAIFTNNFSYAQNGKNNSYLVPVGGGATDNDLMTTIIGLSKKQTPTVLIIPYASEEKNIPAAIEKSTAMFKRIGVTDIANLDVAEPQKAIELINGCDMIWMPGGSQLRLRKALEKGNLVDEILKRYKKGNIVIGGTSAGASIMSDVMMASSNKDKETGELSPVISYGLKLWPEVIIDQHFSERKRLGRLKKAVEKHPNLLGIGIDESTGVIYSNERKITVLGKGTVTFISKKEGEGIKTTVLKDGESYTF